jgi:hypothetical protein
VSEQTTNPTNAYTVPSVSITTACTGASSKANELGMRDMQERAYAKRGEQYLLIKSPPASGKSRALMFIALDKLNNQGLQQAIIVVPERSIGGSFADEPLSQYGFYWDWQVVSKRVNQTVGGQFTPLGAHSASLQLQKSWSTRQVS